MCVLGVNIGDFAEVVIRKWGFYYVGSRLEYLTEKLYLLKKITQFLLPVFCRQVSDCLNRLCGFNLDCQCVTTGFFTCGSFQNNM